MKYVHGHERSSGSHHLNVSLLETLREMELLEAPVLVQESSVEVVLAPEARVDYIDVHEEQQEQEEEMKPIVEPDPPPPKPHVRHIVEPDAPVDLSLPLLRNYNNAKIDQAALTVPTEVAVDVPTDAPEAACCPPLELDNSLSPSPSMCASPKPRHGNDSVTTSPQLTAWPSPTQKELHHEQTAGQVPLDFLDEFPLPPAASSLRRPTAVEQRDEGVVAAFGHALEHARVGDCEGAQQDTQAAPVAPVSAPSGSRPRRNVKMAALLDDVAADLQGQSVVEPHNDVDSIMDGPQDAPEPEGELVNSTAAAGASGIAEASHLYESDAEGGESVSPLFDLNDAVGRAAKAVRARLRNKRRKCARRTRPENDPASIAAPPTQNSTEGTTVDEDIL